MSAPKTTNVLIPNQHIGAYHVGFMGEWLSREYLARHNGFVREKHLVPARCPLFGYALDEMKLDGQFIRQPRVQQPDARCLEITDVSRDHRQIIPRRSPR